MSTTLRDIGSDALTELGVLAAGEELDADGALFLLRVANRLLDYWASRRLMIYSPNVLTTFTIVSGTRDYTVGTGGTINRIRPEFINEVRFIDTGPTARPEYPLTRYLDDDWNRVTLKTLQGVYPIAWYYNPTYPLGVVSLWPVPTSGTLQGQFYAPAAITEFTSIIDAIALPPGYREALVTNLAVRLAPSYSAPITKDTRDAAENALNAIMAANLRPAELMSDAALLGAGGRRRLSYSIRTGQ